MKRIWILLASLSVLLASCGGTTSETPAADDGATNPTQSSTTSTSAGPSDEPDPGEDGEWTLDDFIPGAQQFDENTDYRALELEAQTKVAECMAAEGFDYIPFVPADIGGGFGAVEFDEEEYVKTYGFGVSTWVLQEAEMFEGGEFEDPYANDPNQEIVEAMDEFEQEEYYRLLYGGEPDIITNTPPEEIEAMTDEERDEFFDEAFADWQPDGCMNEAYDELYGGGEADMAFWDEFGDEFEDMYSRVDSDPRIIDARSQWSSCMADKGYQYADQDEMYAYFYGTDVNGQWVEGAFQKAVNEVISLPEYNFEEPVEDGDVVVTTVVGGEFEYQPPEYDLEKLQPLIDEELAIAAANYECETSLRELYETIYEEYQQAFIDENFDRLLEFREQNG